MKIHNENSSVDYLGIISLFLGLASIDIGVIMINFNWIITIPLMIIGCLILILFVYIEKKVIHPLLPM